MDTLATYIFETALSNFLYIAAAFAAGFTFRTAKLVFWLVGGLLIVVLIGRNMAENPDQVRLTETYVASAAGLALGFLVDLLRKRRARPS